MMLRFAPGEALRLIAEPRAETYRRVVRFGATASGGRGRVVLVLVIVCWVKSVPSQGSDK